MDISELNSKQLLPKSVTTDLMKSTGSTSHYLDPVEVRIPPFFKEDVRLWLVQLDSTFKISNINNEIMKYYHVLASLDSEIMNSISDFLSKPLSDSPYTDLKRKLIREYEMSNYKKVKILLEDLKLGDKKPSAFYGEMKSLVGDMVSEDFLKALFLYHLPVYIRIVLAACDEEVSKLADMADQIMELNPTGSSPSSVDRSPSPFVELKAEMEELSSAIQAFKSSRTSSRRTCSKHRTRLRSSSQNIWCWFHQRFRNRAKKCSPPCDFPI